jgi:hypothetical protein
MEGASEALGLVVEQLRQAERVAALQASALAERQVYALSQSLLAIAEQLAQMRRSLSAGVVTKGGDIPSPRTRGQYPRYFQRNGQLVRQALRRDRKSTYEHSVPEGDYLRVVAIMDKLSEHKATFTSADLLAGRENTPSYQVYLTLAYLVEKGILQLKSRGTYYAAEPELLVERARQAWADLTSEA